MSKFTQGSLIFKKKLIETKFHYRDTIEIYDCHPKPQGSRSRFNVPINAPVELAKEYLQPKERELLIEGSKQKTLRDLLQTLSTNFSIKPLIFDHNNIPSKWKKVEECFMKTISVQTRYEVLEITGRASHDVKLGGQTFPKDDVVAVFRIHNPIVYRFILRYEWNDKCCPRKPMRTYPRDYDYYSDEFPLLQAEYMKLPEGWLEKEFPRVEKLLREHDCEKTEGPDHAGTSDDPPSGK